MSANCARCWRPKWVDGGSQQEFGTCMAELDQTEPEEVIACRELEIANLRAKMYLAARGIEEAHQGVAAPEFSEDVDRERVGYLLLEALEALK